MLVRPHHKGTGAEAALPSAASRPKSRPAQAAKWLFAYLLVACPGLVATTRKMFADLSAGANVRERAVRDLPVHRTRPPSAQSAVR